MTNLIIYPKQQHQDVLEVIREVEDELDDVRASLARTRARLAVVYLTALEGSLERELDGLKVRLGQLCSTAA